MSLEDTRKALEGTELEDAIFEMAHRGATVDEAADAAGIDPDEVAKTLSFLLGDEPILILVSGTSKIDNRKYKYTFKKKAKMIPSSQVEELIGHPVGGVNPFGIKPGVKVYLDESLKAHDIVYPSAGQAEFAVKAPLPLLEKLCGYEYYVDVTKK